MQSIRLRSAAEALGAAVRHWRVSWLGLSIVVKALWSAVMAIAVLSAGIIVAQVGSTEFLFNLATSSYAVVPLGAGFLVIMGAQTRRGPGAGAWTLIGLGVAAWGVGELIWVYYSAVLEVEVPYPGWADVFYVVAYPIIFAGILMLPHVRSGRWERVRLTLDALAGTVALGAIVWTYYLRDALYIDPNAGLLENSINLAYPTGDLILLVALMILTTRRSKLQFDGRLLVLSLGVAVTAFADMAYVFQMETYEDGSRLDAAWLVAYGLFACAALLVAGPVRIREQADRPGRVWPMIAPYTAICLLFALTVGEIGDQATTLQGATAVVGVLIIVRQGVAIRETRDIVEKQRNDLVASISHELRTPLTAMSGFTDLLDADPDLDRADRIEMTAIVNSQTKHLARIVGDLVEVARNQLETTTLTYSSIGLRSLVDSAIGMLTSGASAAEVTNFVDPGLDVVADEDRVRQVLVNYLTNAARYGDGTIEVHARVTGGEVVIEVHDNGPGIPKKYEVTIWDRFERGPQTYLSKVQGSGLGLAIARQLIQAHGGHTGHRPSERLGGACFWLSIPRHKGVPSTSAPVVSRAGGAGF